MRLHRLVRNIFLFLAVCIAAMNPAQAGPANPEPFQIAQPDGTMLQVIMRGDEFQGWMETSDGYTIVRNPATEFYEYATHGAGGELIPSGIQISASFRSKMAVQGLMPPKGLRPPRNTALEQYQGEFLSAARSARARAVPQAAPVLTGTWALTPVSGTKKILLILVNFQDASLSASAATYWNNAVHNATGSSVAKYYQDVSFGAVSISPVAHTQPGSPAGVVTVSLAQNHPNQGGNYTYAVESAWINSALAAAAPYVNFAALDTNGDGTISVDETLVYFIVAGYETSAGSGMAPSYWAHAWGGTGVGVSGKNVNHWALNGEKYDASNLMQMGVIAHEMGHAMGGLPDLYDISGNNAGLGIFSLMASGSWGRRVGELGGTTPVGLDAWSRQYLGWSTPQFPANGASISFGSPLSSPAASVMLMNGASSTSEYWLVENRPPVGWDAGMYPYLGSWTGGLLIQHLDLNVGSKSANSFNEYVSGAHQGNLAEEPSTATCSLKVVTTPSSYSRGCQKILYYSGNSTTFNGGSTPNSNYYSGAASSLGITGISAPGNTMTATVQTPVTSTCSYALGASSASLGAGATVGAVSVTTTAACTWTAMSNASWITVTSGTSGSGTGTVAYSVAANTGASSRTGTLTIAGQTFTVTQSGSGGGTTGSLTTTFAGGLYGANGNMFDVQALSGDVTINRFDLSLYITAGTVVPVSVYYKTGSYVGYEATASAWTLLGTYSVTSAGPGSPSSMPVGNLLLTSGQTYGIYLTATDGTPFLYTNSANTYSNANLQVTLGAGVYYPFGTVYSPRTWNGTIYYTAGGTSATVPGAPTITAAVAGNGSATISFTAPSSTGGAAISGYKATCGTTTVSGASSPITVAPLNNGTSYACTVKATNSVGDSAPSAAVYVTPIALMPPVCTLTATPASISAGGSSTLTANCTPAATSYAWTGGACAGNTTNTCTVSPATTTTYTVIGSNAAGSGNIAKASIIVGTPTVRNALFINASSSTNKTTVIRVINRTNQTGVLIATAYDDAGHTVGNAGAFVGNLAAQQTLALTSAQFEALAGYSPSASTAKYRAVFSSDLTNFAVINLVKDVATGNVTLGQAQTDDRPASAATTRDALFVNASTSSNKTSVLRLINLTSQAGSVTATAYDESGNIVGISGVSIGSIQAQQTLALTSAQLETMIGYSPSSPTAKYRIAFSSNLSGFEVINFVKDVATGSVTLGQAQVD